VQYSRMKQSTLFTTTLRTVSAEETAKNAQLLVRGGYVQKTMAGVYSYLPLGLRVIENIKKIVREELATLPRTHEVLMSALQPKELWDETGRWDAAVGDVMYTTAEDKIGLGPTHEELATDIFRTHVQSYRSMPVSIFQIQTKFRKELRAKSGLLRGREFLMKDLYSFHATEEEFKEYYELAAAAYLRIFERCGTPAIRVAAAGGMFSDFSDEFQVLTDIGEDTIYLRADGMEGRNDEIVKDATDPELLAYCGGEVRTAKAVEVGNIFPLGTKFSKSMDAGVAMADGSRIHPIMGCYGIGISRLCGVLAELHGTEKGIAWPAAVAPFQVHILDLLQNGEGEELYGMVKAKNIEVLLDDREVRAGEAFGDADMIGAPIRVVVSERAKSAGGLEVTQNGSQSILTQEQFLAMLSA